ncbi:alpha-L-fucosidase [Chitinophaga sp. Hz27]|uniref:alpha-L-fucosidase n=1 Tax=Chitinophaga sp. Hz27 TaxID=3347169 RepID=UPI0035E0136C
MKVIGLSILFCFLMLMSSQAQTPKSSSLQTFMGDRFGMFIHWGPVSLRGTEIGWSRGKEVPQEEYDSLYKEFDPVLFNADAWVKAAKDAGMKYLTITARHHDGFCLWPTKYTDYNIANTPYKKDILAALSTACKKQNIKFCIYYSVLDWHHPDYPMHGPDSQTPDPKADMNKYIVFMKQQLKELITQYDPYMLWFDGQWESPWTDAMGKEIYAYVKALKPSVITNNRLGKAFAAMDNKEINAADMIGDYDTPERVVGRLNMQMPWESCFTICQQWSWKPNDKLVPLKKCLSIISQTAGSNGNLLLNVGPMPDGRIEARQVKRLKELGDWLKVNGTAIYNTAGGPYLPTENYVTTRSGNNIYVHVLNTDTALLTLPALPGVVIKNAHTISGEPVVINTKDDHINIALPASMRGATQYIIVLELNKDALSIPVVMRKTKTIIRKYTDQTTIDASKLTKESFSATIMYLKEAQLMDKIMLTDAVIAKEIGLADEVYTAYMQDDEKVPNDIFDTLRQHYGSYLKGRCYQIKAMFTHPDPFAAGEIDEEAQM